MDAPREKFEYYVVFTFMEDGERKWGCFDTVSPGPLSEPEHRLSLVKELSPRCPGLILVNWKRNQ